MIRWKQTVFYATKGKPRRMYAGTFAMLKVFRNGVHCAPTRNCTPTVQNLHGDFGPPPANTARALQPPHLLLRFSSLRLSAAKASSSSEGAEGADGACREWEWSM